MFSPEQPKWDQNPKIYTPKRDYEYLCPFQMGVTLGNLPGSLLQSSWVPWSSWLPRPGHCSLPTVSTLPICPSECHASCHELCPKHCCKVSSFSVSLCLSHCRTACDLLRPSHCCSQQLTPTTVPIQLTWIQFVSHNRAIYTRKN